MSYKTEDIRSFINSKMISGEGYIGNFSVYTLIIVASLIPLIRLVAVGLVVYRFYMQE